MTIDLSQLLTILGSAGSTMLTLWAFSRDFNKQKRATLQEYASAQVEANGLQRDIGHLKRDAMQMSANVEHLNEEYEARFREIESKLSHLTGVLETFRALKGNG